MDPYLEHPEFFPGLHDRLITALSDLLQAQLPQAYYVDIRSRVWIEYPRRVVEPDVNVLRTDRPSGLSSSVATEALAVRTPPVRVPAPEEVSESFLEIHTVQGDHPLVTAIEVLSPSNKTPGEHGRTHYQEKQLDLLLSRVNLVEIDLLRGGQHTTAVPGEVALATTGPFDYHVCIRKMDDLEHFFVYAIRLEQRLPELLIPLLPGDPDVKVDLQAVFDRCYDAGPYRRRSPYRAHSPDPPLSAEQAAWATQLLRDKGLLPPE
jgi:hypothetical protein